LYGIEIEARKDFGFLSPSLSNLNVNGNVTLVKSTIEMTDMEFNSRMTYQKEGENISDKRSMAGQSPYVINAGIGYNSTEAGLDAGLFYNVKGSTLSIVGAGLFPDIYSEPFHSLNFSLSKKLGKNKNSSVDLKISNLLDSEVKSVYRSYQAADQIYSLQNPGRSFSLGFSYQF
jgi:outer membrane receptor protein involved in Fe transport